MSNTLQQVTAQSAAPRGWKGGIVLDHLISMHEDLSSIATKQQPNKPLLQNNENNPNQNFWDCLYIQGRM